MKNIINTEKNDRMQQLVTTLNAASAAYYSGATETMPNIEWDALYDELSALENEAGYKLPNSPTATVGAPVLGQKEPHEYPALSLNKSKEVSDILKWAGDKELCLSWKLDGMTLVVTYDNGHLTKVVTRGDGHAGTNITHLAAAITGIPQSIPSESHVVVRGEAIISLPAFNEINEKLAGSGNAYANPRNLVAGSLSLDAERANEVAERRVCFYPFTLVKGDDALERADLLRRWEDQMLWLEQMGFSAVPHTSAFAPSSLPATISEWTVMMQAGENELPADGLVVVFNDTAYAKTFTVTGHHDNGAGMAFKWQDTTASTTSPLLPYSTR